ncbi:FCD domain-containing protein [Kribbella sp. WER1]
MTTAAPAASALRTSVGVHTPATTGRPRAALRSKPADLAQLTGAIDTMYAALDQRDLHTFVSADVSFHIALLDLSGSKIFECLSSVIATAVRTRETLVFPVVDAHKEANRALGVWGSGEPSRL